MTESFALTIPLWNIWVIWEKCLLRLVSIFQQKEDRTNFNTWRFWLELAFTISNTNILMGRNLLQNIYDYFMLVYKYILI